MLEDLKKFMEAGFIEVTWITEWAFLIVVKPKRGRNNVRRGVDFHSRSFKVTVN